MSKTFKLLSGDVSGVPATYVRLTELSHACVYEVNEWADMDSSAVETHGKYNVQAGVVWYDMYRPEQGIGALSYFGYRFEGPTGELVSDSGDTIADVRKDYQRALLVLIEAMWAYGCKDVSCDVSGNNLRKLIREARGSL